MSQKKILNKAIENIYSLTPLQEGMLFHALNKGDSSQYILQSTFCLDFAVDEPALRKAIVALSDRYDALRTAVVYAGMAKPRQVVLKKRAPEYSCHDLSAHDEPVAEMIVQELRNAEIKRGFDLQKDPLLRFCCVKIKQTSFKLIWTMHHIIVDGWCMSLLSADLMRYYEQFAAGCAEDDVARIIERERLENSEYAQYIKWLEKRNAIEGLNFWEKYLADYDSSAGILPTELPSKTESQMQKYIFRLSQEATDACIRLSSKHRVTTSTLLQTAWGIVLQKYNHCNDVVFGKVVSGRNAPIRGIESMVGLFANTIAARVRTLPEETVLDLLQRQQRENNECEEITYCSLAEVQNKTQCENLIRTLFAFENYYVAPTLSENYGHMIREESSREQTNYEITVSAFKDEDGIGIDILYDPNFYTKRNMAQIAKHYQNVIEYMALHTSVQIADIRYIDLQEEARILGEFNDTTTEYPKDRTVGQSFEQQAALRAEATALVFGDRTLSYRELNEKANCLAHKLRDLGVDRGDMVAILPKRSMETIIGLCAILKSGAAYVPIDPSYPEQRIADILADCRPKAVITYRAQISTDLPVIDLTKQSLTDGNTENLPCINEPTDAACCIYTSGTTGKPKGVLIKHHSIHNLVIHCDYMPFGVETRTIQTGQLVFDASTFEIWGTLLNGGCLHIINEDLLLDPDGFANYLREQRINQQFVTTALFNQYVSCNAAMFDGVKSIAFGGERASEECVRRLLARNPDVQLTNAYGPTESTTIAVRYKVEGAPKGTLPIGKPIHNTQIYILQGMQLCGIGVPGELCIAGDGLAKGYLNRPELTEEKFVQNPYGEGRMYRTGDLARWLPDGNIEFLGRIDEQVKIRGFRIELGEIESVLRSIEGVQDCAVIVRKDAGDSVLCAYVVGREHENLQDELRRSLPEYMIPTHIAYIEKIPLTTNGKLNKKALPKIEGKKREYIAPRDETEETVCQAMCKVLGVEKIGVFDNFFEIGGHSLKSAQLVNLLHSGITIKDVFELKTVAGLAQRMRGSVIEENNDGIERTEEAPYYAMSDAQKRLFIFEQIDETKRNYNVPHCFRLTGEFDEERATQAWKKLIARHESLRSTFEMNGEEFRQIVHADAAFAFEHRRFNEGTIEEEMNRFLRPYDLTKLPLLRGAIAQDAEENRWLLLDFHHIIVDGQSADVLLEEFESLYNGKSLEKEPLQYRDYSAWLQKKDMKKQEQYWLESFQNEQPDNDLPLDHKRTEESTHKGALTRHKLKIEQKQVEAYCAKQDVTPYVFFTAALSTMLRSYYDADDVTLGTPVACRTHADAERIVGMLVNTLPMRSYPQGEKVFSHYLQEVKQIVLSALENQEYPFNVLTEKLKAQRPMGRNPLFDVFFNYFDTNTMRTLKGEGFEAQQCQIDIGAGKFDAVVDVVLQEGGYALVCNYKPSLIEEETAKRMLCHFENVIESALKNGEAKISELNMLSEAEEAKISSFCREKKYDESQTFISLFRAQAKKQGEKIALVCGEEKISYAQLDELTDRTASALIAKGIGKEEIVGVMAGAGTAAFIGAIGAMKAGAAYMPIDPLYPKERIAYMLEKSRCRVVLAEQKTEMEESLLISEAVKAEITQMPEIKGTELAYVIFTSGSTGAPKGVMVEHRALSNLIQWHNEYYEMKPEDKTTKYAGFGFDASVHEMYPQLAVGAQIHIIPEQMRMDLPAIQAYVEKERINVGFFPTPVCEQFAKLHTTALEKVITGGDKLKTYAKDYTIYNNYGPTEGTVLSTVFKVDRGYENIPIGRPIENVKVHIVSRDGKRRPIGMAGELWLSGKQLARGYINDEERTKERFLDHPIYGRVYKTGDVGRWLPDGNIEYLGRNDDQVKVRGNRIELSEIEAAICARCGVTQCAAIVDKTTGSERIALFYVNANETEPAQMRQTLSAYLPRYMLPDVWIKLERFELTRNGKIDKKRLSVSSYQTVNSIQVKQPTTQTEQTILDIWKQALQLESIDVEDNFFEVGGTSLTLAMMFAKLNEKFPNKLNIADVFANPSIRKLAAFIASKTQKQTRLSLNGVALKDEFFGPSERLQLTYRIEKLEQISDAQFAACTLYALARLAQTKNAVAYMQRPDGCFETISLDLNGVSTFNQVLQKISCGEAWHLDSVIRKPDQKTLTCAIAKANTASGREQSLFDLWIVRERNELRVKNQSKSLRDATAKNLLKMMVGILRMIVDEV